MLKELRAKAKAARDAMQAILDKAASENRAELTQDEVAAFEASEAEHAALAAQIGRHERVGALTAEAATHRPAVAAGGGIVHPAGDPAKSEFESFGHFMAAVRFAPNDQRLNYVENAGRAGGDGDEVHGEMRMDDGASGGFAVPAQFRDEMLQVSPQEALVRGRARVIPAGSPPDASITMPALDHSEGVYGGVEVQWIGEGDEKPETDAKLRQVTLTPHEVAGFVTVTDKLLRNWAASDGFIRNLLREAVYGAEDFAFLRGNGVAKPLGVLNSPARYVVPRTTANQVVYEDLVNMVARLLMRGAGSPVWSMPQSLLPFIATLKDEAGNLIWAPNAQAGFAGTLLGYPVRWNNRSPALGQEGDVLLADFSYYLIKDGSGPFVAASEHVKFTSNKTVIKIFWNVDGQPWLLEPFTEENGYEVSPFVVLGAPAG
jgi:HK97 family phage major capsid protein